MYYYAYINSDSIVTGVYQLPTEVSMAGYIAITQEQYTNGNLVGKFYNAETGEFVSLPDWIGSTDEVKYKQTAVVLSAKLDAMDEAIASAQAGADGASAYEIAVANGFEGSEEQWLASLVGATGATGEQGVQGEKGEKGDKGDTGETGAAGASGQNGTTVIVGTTTTGNAGTNANVTGTLNSETNTLTLDFTIPKGANGESGTSASITADEVLTKIKTVDGANSGLDADTLDGVHANGFANAVHTHSGYASTSDIETLQTAINGKANANHTHNYCTLNQVYPVGSIYLSVNSANPSTLFGGTWVAFGTGRVLMGVKSGGSAEATGGSESATISAHTHTTASHKLTVEEMPPHHHEILNYNENGVTTDTFTKNSVEGLIKKGWTGNVMTSYTGGNQAHSHGNTGSAGAATISVVQPYITCYMWKRTN